MVSFFDQKEEVLTVELTPYGKQQFAEGLFAPAYYAFYDSSIIYDSDYIKLTETQNRTTTRITTETPKLKPNVRFNSTPGSVYSLLTSNDSSGFAQDKPYNANYARTLGSSDPNSSNLPSWKIQTLNLSDVGFNEGVRYNLDNTIPQMSATLFIDYETLEGTGVEGEPAIYTLLGSDSLFLNVEELNTLFKNNGNFDIEVYKSGSEGTMTPLGFINREASQGQSLQSQTDPFVLANNIRGNNNNIVRGFPILDDKYVEFYLNLSVDTEISFITSPTNSTLYKRSIDRTPEDPCDVLDTLPEGYDLG
tara:strand:- start:724 stop:1641 length:918 start_codon:yes stop_codon:yes gene_type:complete